MRPVCLLIPVLFVVSCKPILETEAGPAFHTPLSTRSECVVLGLSDTIAIHGDPIGDLDYSQTMTSTPWDPIEIARYFQGEALHNGGNLVKIKKYDDNSGGRSLLTVQAAVYYVSDIRHYEKQIEWTPGRKLNLSDFKGPADSALPGQPALRSYSGCDFYLFSQSKFYCYDGWIDRTSPDSLRLLAHEQGNFDLTEIYRRQLDENVLRYENRGASQTRATEHVFREVYSAYLAKQAQYERETGHGLDSAEQTKWTKSIAAELANTSGKHDPLFAANPDFMESQKDSLISALAPQPGKALVYLIRPKTISTPLPSRVLYDPMLLLFGAPYLYFVNGNSYTVGFKDSTTDPIHGRTFVFRNLTPDRYTFTAFMNKGDRDKGAFGAHRYKKSEGMELSLSAGKVYYLLLNTGDSWFSYATPQLKLISEKEGRELIRKCSLASTGEDVDLPGLTNPLE